MSAELESLGKLLQAYSTGQDTLLMHVTTPEAANLIKTQTGGVPKFNKHTGLLSADPNDPDDVNEGDGAGDASASDAGAAGEMGGAASSSPASGAGHNDDGIAGAVGDMVAAALGVNGVVGTGKGFGGFGKEAGALSAIGEAVATAAKEAGMDVSTPTDATGDMTGPENEPGNFGGGNQGNDQGPGSEPNVQVFDNGVISVTDASGFPIQIDLDGNVIEGQEIDLGAVSAEELEVILDDNSKGDIQDKKKNLDLPETTANGTMQQQVAIWDDKGSTWLSGGEQFGGRGIMDMTPEFMAENGLSTKEFMGKNGPVKYIYKDVSISVPDVKDDKPVEVPDVKDPSEDVPGFSLQGFDFLDMPKFDLLEDMSMEIDLPSLTGGTFRDTFDSILKQTTEAVSKTGLGTEDEEEKTE